MKMYGKLSTMLLILLGVCTYAFKIEQIRFQDLSEPGLNQSGDMPLGINWGAVGVDNLNQVYILFGSNKNPEDCSLFRYNPKTEERKFLGSLRKTAKEQGTLWKGEELPKGHTPIVYLNGKMWFATQNFHEANRFTDLSRYHGSHLFSVDVHTGEMIDHAQYFSDNVLQRGQGIICVNTMPSRNLIVGYSHPLGDVLFYNIITRKLDVVKPVGKVGQLARSMVVSDERGKVYTHYSRCDYSVTDVSTLNRETVDYTEGGYWNGHAQSWDGKKLYVAGVNGVLYEIDAATNTATKITQMYSSRNYQFCLALSHDEKRIFSVVTDGPDEKKLYEVDLETKTTKNHGKISDKGAYTGFNARDGLGNIYFSKHTYRDNSTLVKIDLSEDMDTRGDWRAYMHEKGAYLFETVPVVRKGSGETHGKITRKVVHTRYTYSGKLKGISIIHQGRRYDFSGRLHRESLCEIGIPGALVH
jgi:hypothetical protein